MWPHFSQHFLTKHLLILFISEWLKYNSLTVVDFDWSHIEADAAFAIFYFILVNFMAQQIYLKTFKTIIHLNSQHQIPLISQFIPILFINDW